MDKMLEILESVRKRDDIPESKKDRHYQEISS